MAARRAYRGREAGFPSRRARLPRRAPVAQVPLAPWDPRRLAAWLFLGVLASAATWWVVSSLRDFILDLVAAFLVAVAAEPAIQWLRARGMRRSMATGVVLGGSIAAMAALLLVLGNALLAQVFDIVDTVPGLLSQAVQWVSGWTSRTLGGALPGFDAGASPLAGFTAWTAGGVLQVAGTAVTVAVNVATVLVFACYFAASGPALREFAATWVPVHRRAMVESLWEIAVRKAGGFVLSRVVLAAISSVAHAVAFWVIGVPYWLAMGIFAGVTSQFIPVVGTYLGALVPAALTLPVSPWSAAWVLGFAVVYQQVENYLLTPRICGRTMDVNPAASLAAVIAGAVLLGPAGALLGVPVAAITVAMLQAHGRWPGPRQDPEPGEV